MAAFLVVLLIIGLRIAATEDDPTVTDSQPSGANSSDVGSSSNAPPTSANAADQPRDSRASVNYQEPTPKPTRVAEAKNSLVREDLTRVIAKREAVEQGLGALTALVGELSSSEAGRQFGQVQELLESYMETKQRLEAVSRQYDTTRRDLILLQAEIEEQLDLYPSTMLPESLVSQLGSLGKSLDESEVELRQCRLGLAALVSEGAKHPAGERSLAEQVETYQVDKQKVQLQAIAEERKRLDEEAIEAQKRDEQKLAEAKEKLRQEKAAQELALVEAEKEAAKIAAAEQERKILLEAEFKRDLPKIQHYLGPLFVKTTKQPGGGDVIETKESKPVSLTALNAVGLSNPDVSKACGSLLLFFSYFKAGGRGQGPYPSEYHGAALNQDQLAVIRPAYDLLDKYGELLVEKGMLAE
jgi:hypothetical protein